MSLESAAQILSAVQVYVSAVLQLLLAFNQQHIQKASCTIPEGNAAGKVSLQSLSLVVVPPADGVPIAR